MNKKEFSELKRGDIVRPIGSEADSFVIDKLVVMPAGERVYMASQVAMLTTGDDWDLLEAGPWGGAPSEREAAISLNDVVAGEDPNIARLDRIRHAMESTLPGNAISLGMLAVLWGVTQPRMVNKIREISDFPAPSRLHPVTIYPAAAALHALLRHLDGEGGAAPSPDGGAKAYFAEAQAIADEMDQEDATVTWAVDFDPAAFLLDLAEQDKDGKRTDRIFKGGPLDGRGARLHTARVAVTRCYPSFAPHFEYYLQDDGTMQYLAGSGDPIDPEKEKLRDRIWDRRGIHVGGIHIPVMSDKESLSWKSVMGVEVKCIHIDRILLQDGPLDGYETDIPFSADEVWFGASRYQRSFTDRNTFVFVVPD